MSLEEGDVPLSPESGRAGHVIVLVALCAAESQKIYYRERETRYWRQITAFGINLERISLFFF